MTMNCSNPECEACRLPRIPISAGVYPASPVSLWIVVVIMFGLALGIGALISGCGGEASDASGQNCVLCAPSGILSCADPGENPCPDAKPTDALPVCGVPAGYSVSVTDCGGATINGLRCATDCSWQIGADPSLEILGHASIAFPPGCTLPVAGEAGVCVVNCSDCR